MLKKLFLAFLFAIILTTTTLAAEDFSQMNPTVKVASYKNLFTDNVLAYGSGSGTIVTSNGVIVTNHHVIFDEDEFKPLDTFEVCITFDVQEEPVCKYTARLIADDKDLDIALLKINSNDVFGKDLPTLKYLSYKNETTPQEQDEIQIVGYPGSGGETITITKGQVSGFETFNGYRYFKTDTDFDMGSSGGTAMDQNDNFVGIPTYLRSYAENVGYFLDLREAQDWIDGNINKIPQENLDAEQLLSNELARFSKANDELEYTQSDYPFIGVTLPEGWEFLEINNNSFYASQKNVTNPAGFSVFINHYQFTVDEGYMNKLDEELEGIKDSFPDYKKEMVTFAGKEAWKITYTSFANQNTTYYIPYGYTIIGLNYSIDLDEAEKQEKAIQPALSSFQFTKLPLDDPGLSQTIQFDEPPFEITVYENFRIQKNISKYPMNLLAEAVEKENFEGSFAVYYDQVPKDERHLSAKDRLEERIENLGGRKLVYKSDEVVLGGLTGFLYTYEYEGQEYQEIRKHLLIKIRDEDYEFTLKYDDLTENFDRNLPTIRKILDSFQFKGETTEDKSLHEYGSLGFTFSDIQFHRFALAISDLADKGIVSGYSDGTFRPEIPVNRAEALKMILESKNHLETEKGLGKEIDFMDYQSKIQKLIGYLTDIRTTDWFSKYVSYAFEKEVIKGYPDKTFRGYQTVTLAEALKLIFHVYEIPIWEGATDPWFKKYMDKGFELNLIPYGMYDPGQSLTRAELSYLVNKIYKEADNQYGFNFYY